MPPKDRKETMKLERETLIKELEEVYLNAFNRIGNLNLSDGSITKLTQVFLRSRQGAIEPLEERIEKTIITKAPNINPRKEK